MADDSMEITSEHMQSGEDIDIDIDFSAHPADDDYILQDAQSNADYGDEFLPHQSPTHHDDQMIDDDNASYQMEDADLIHDEAVQSLEPELMSFASSDMPLGGGTIVATTQSEVEDHDINLFGEDHYASDAAGDSSGLVPQDNPHGHTATNVENSTEDVDYNSTAQVFDEGQEFPKDGGQFSHEQNRVHRSSAAVLEEHKSPASVLMPGSTNPEQEVHGPSTSLDHNSRDDSLGVQEPDTTGPALNSSPARDVQVIYQSTEYALFASSDSDDPDSFFLRDLSVMEKPLDQFFKAIREVIRGDLSASEELCLNVEDLGLETEEASSPLINVTLAQILSLHQKLLHNDGVENPGPLYLTLGTRIGFSRRFTTLTGGALQGKGLSEFSMPDSNSESIDGEDEPGQAVTGIESSIDQKTSEDLEDGSTVDAETLQPSDRLFNNYENNAPGSYGGHHQPEEYKEYEADVGAKDTETEGDVNLHNEEHLVPLQEEGSKEEISAAEAQPGLQIQMLAANSDIQESGFDDDDSSFINNSQHSPHRTDMGKASPKPGKEVVSSEDSNQDGDLIDYSDEEIEFPNEALGHTTDMETTNAGTNPILIQSCYKPEMCYCFECSLLISAEYNAKDEELRRRSISHQSEEKLPEQAIGQSPVETHGDEEVEHETADAETGYRESGSDLPTEAQSGRFEIADLAADRLADHEENQIDFSNPPENFEDDEAAYVFGVDGEVEDVHDGSNNFSRVRDLDDEVVLRDTSPYTERIQVEASGVEAFNTLGSGHERLPPSTASSLGVAETAESSVTLGAEEIQYDDDDDELDGEASDELAKVTPIIPSFQEDEIGYEDDEDEESPILISSEAITVPKVLSNSHGKRSIAEVESGMSTPIKDAKRPRS